ncbi:Electron transfer flavoprotein, beta subunit [Marinobacterium lacunae]|uniref:Electron transfer flavoprotein, beta subunit n=1 Tax=Marinobacterium lacunae TaxID=1232683 RepID=A0A081FZ19_9GAMM|nr:electron transfer flavoprotein subunit beta [Marinobacterium lacunae]KEA63774.1 Electron transfer flavoprotein, beta subunit [Marinobacterium lacunae]MBR9882452.1 electron transfer flavoprotein subunit beta [Oceanospirillales bacterium]
MQPDKQNLNLRITALVSLGKHPGSGRERRAEQDARAVEMGLTLSPKGLEVLHAGNPQSESLRAYAGMGLKMLRVLEQGEGADAVPALSHYLNQQKPDIVLTGVRAESGESSGMMPYLLGKALGWPVVTRIAEIVSIDHGEANLLQALPRGQRRALRVPLPFVASVDMAAQAPRQSAFGPASRAQMETDDVGVEILDEVKSLWSEAPARKRPKRLKVVKAKTAADRFKAATAKSSGDGGKVLRDKPASEMAQAVFDLLLEEGVIR